MYLVVQMDPKRIRVVGNGVVSQRHLSWGSNRLPPRTALLRELWCPLGNPPPLQLLLLLLEPSLLGSLRRVWVKPSDDAHLGQTKAIGLSRVLPISTLTTTTMGNYHGP